MTLSVTYQQKQSHTSNRSFVTNNINFIFLITKRGKISQKHAQMYLWPIIHCAMNMNIIVFKLNWVTLYWWEKEKGRKNKWQGKTKIQSKTNLKTKKKECVADELTDQMKHYLLYVIFFLRNQVKAPLVIMDGRLGWPLFRTMWFWLRWL